MEKFTCGNTRAPKSAKNAQNHLTRNTALLIISADALSVRRAFRAQRFSFQNNNTNTAFTLRAGILSARFFILSGQNPATRRSNRRRGVK
jgi:hypothetical protein